MEDNNKKKSKYGRKKIADEDFKKNRIVRISDKEYKGVLELMKAEGFNNFTDYARARLLKPSKKKAYFKNVSNENSKKLIIELSRHGGNLNQIAHNINIYKGKINAENVKYLKEFLPELLTAYKDLVELINSKFRNDNQD